MLGQRDAARVDFERALKADPCQFEARFNLRQMGVDAAAPASCRYTPEQRDALEGLR
jgi:Tfp pilus assembly protein PilF